MVSRSHTHPHTWQANMKWSQHSHKKQSETKIGGKKWERCTQQINQLALPKTFEIDFKFFGPLFLYATKGQFFISNDNNKSNTRSFSNMHTHTAAHTRTSWNWHTHAVDPWACKLAALFMSSAPIWDGHWWLSCPSLPVVLPRDYWLSIQFKRQP